MKVYVPPTPPDDNEDWIRYVICPLLFALVIYLLWSHSPK